MDTRYHLKSLSGIETKQGSLQTAEPKQLDITLNPYQGLKLPLVVVPSNVILTTRYHLKSLSGIETSLASYQQFWERRLDITLNPYQGLKLSPPLQRDYP